MAYANNIFNSVSAVNKKFRQKVKKLQFRHRPVGQHMVRVCHGTACHVRGATNISLEVQQVLDLAEEADTTADNKYTVEKVACLGCCSLAPVVMIDEKVYGGLDRKKVRRIFKQLKRKEAKA